MRQVPGQIAADHRVEARIRERERFRVHFHKADLAGQSAGVFFCLGEHGGREVDRGHVTAQLPQQDREKARSGADLEHAQLRKAAVGELPRKLGTQTGLPLLPLRGIQLQPADLRIAGGAPRPIASVFFKDRLSIHRRHVALSVFLRFSTRESPLTSPRGD